MDSPFSGWIADRSKGPSIPIGKSANGGAPELFLNVGRLSITRPYLKVTSLLLLGALLLIDNQGAPVLTISKMDI